MVYRCWHDANLTMDYVSDGCLDLTGYSQEEMVRSGEILYKDIIHPDERQEVMSQIGRAVLKNSPYRLVYRITNKHGRTRWVRDQGRIYSRTGHKVVLMGFITDITELKELELENQYAREFNENLIQTANALVLVLNEKGNIILFNRETERISGYSLEDVKYKNWFSLTKLPGDYDTSRKILEKALNSEEEVSFQSVIFSCKGRKYCIDWRVRPLKQRDFTGVIAIGIDVTHKQKAEAALRESEERYKLLSEYSTDGIMMLEKGNLKYLSPSFRKMLELEELSIPNDRFRDFYFSLIHPEDLDGLLATLRQAYTKNQTDVRFAYRIRKNRSGDNLWLEDTIFLSYGTDGSLDKLIIHTRDITAQKTAEAALRLSEKKFRNIVELAPHIPIVIFDSDGTVSFVNRAMESITGCRHGSLLSKKIGDLLPDRSEFMKLKTGDGDELWRTNELYEVTVKDTRRKDKHLLGSIFRLNIDERESQFISMNIDITDLKNTQQELKESRDNLERRNRKYSEINTELKLSYDRISEINVELLEAKNRAEESDRLKSAFLANMSHEVRTPMNAILGFSDLLNEPGLSTKKRSVYTYLISRKSNDLLNIIDEIMDISQIQSKQVSPSQHRFGLAPLMKELYEYAGRYDRFDTAKAVKIRLDNRLMDTGVQITGDQEKVRKILFHLVSNARKFTHEGFIEFGYYTELTGHLLFYVRDTGIGIEPEKHQVIFDLFRQSDEDYRTRGYGGIGLGLSISRGFIELMGGKIGVESQPGRGSVFYFTIPAVLQGPDGKQTTVKKSETWKNLTFLIVEPEQSRREHIRLILKNSGAGMAFTSSGWETLDILGSGQGFSGVIINGEIHDMTISRLIRDIGKINPSQRVVTVTDFPETPAGPVIFTPGKKMTGSGKRIGAITGPFPE